MFLSAVFEPLPGGSRHESPIALFTKATIVRSDSFFQDVETLNIMNREDLTYFLFVNSKLNELLHREDLQKLAEEDNPIIILME